MDVSDLLDIKAICDAGSYRKAAETLGVTQPTLSNRIAYLEGKPRRGTAVKGHRTTRGRSSGSRPDRDGSCPRPRLA